MADTGMITVRILDMDPMRIFLRRVLEISDRVRDPELDRALEDLISAEFNEGEEL